MAGVTVTTKTETGFLLERRVAVSRIAITRREDLKGCYEVADNIYGSIKDAREAAESILDTAAEGFEWAESLEG